MDVKGLCKFEKAETQGLAVHPQTGEIFFCNKSGGYIYRFNGPDYEDYDCLLYTSNLGANIQAHDKISSIVKYHDSFFVGLMMDGVLTLEKQKGSGEYQIQKMCIRDSACTVFTIIQKYDSLWSINSWRTAFRQLAVEVSVTG